MFDERKNVDWNKIILKIDAGDLLSSKKERSWLSTVIKHLIWVTFFSLLIMLSAPFIKSYLSSIINAYKLKIQYNQNTINEMQRRLDEQYRKFERFKNETARAQVEIVKSLSEELRQIQKENSRLYKELQITKAKLEAVTKLRAVTNAGLSRDLGVKWDVHKGQGKNEYYLKYVYWKYKDPKTGNIKKIPVAWVMYYPNREEGKRWKTGVDQLAFDVILYRARQKSGATQEYAKVLVKNTRAKEYRNVSIPVRIEDFKTKLILPKEESFFLWNPTLNVSLIPIGLNVDSYPTFGLSFYPITYGKTKRDISWKFAGVTGYPWGLQFNPVSWNISSLTLDMTKNTFISPAIGYDFETKKINFSVNLELNF